MALLFVAPLKASNYGYCEDCDEFRRKANEEYAQSMRERWEAFNAYKGEPEPVLPEPPQLFERDKDTPIPKQPNIITVCPIPSLGPAPMQPKPRPDVPQLPPWANIPKFSFTCYGTPCEVRLHNKMKFRLQGVSENAVADAWLHLSSKWSDALLEDCLSLKDKMALGDWAYLCLLRDLSQQYLGKGSNEATLMMVYLLAQSGYKVRIGQQKNRLIPLLPFDDVIYERSYITHKGESFYAIDKNEEGRVRMFNKAFTRGERVMSLRMDCPPKFAFKGSESRSFKAKRYPELSVTVSPNKNLLDFYEGYPCCMWMNYSWAGLSDDIKDRLYPMLRQGIAEQGQIEAANCILNFVQTAFKSRIDPAQFGRERSLFADETFFYPFCDCEDRAILFSILVRDLLGLDVVLLYFPGHLATAVCYTEALEGTNFVFEGKTYYVCDPGHIGANVGELSARYAKETSTIYKL